MDLTAGNVWMMIAAALVLLMTPGVAFFYGGLSRVTAALNMMMMSFISMGIVGVIWAAYGYSMGSSGQSILGLFGNPFEYPFLYGAEDFTNPGGMISAGYGATFAIITVALISGALADRTKFAAWLIFVPVWATLVYFPLAYMVWNVDNGLLNGGALGALLGGAAIDFAGGTVVHISAGVAALALVLVVGRRINFPDRHKPHNIPFVMLGAAILWFGWFGFNGGLAANASQGGLIWVNTLVAPGAAMLVWLITEKLRTGHVTTVGAASGVVAGLVGITPACANVDVVGALVIGGLCGLASALAIELKYKLGYDDSLDVVGVHLVSGLIGTIMIGFLASPAVFGPEGGPAGLFYGGGLHQLGIQIVAALFSIVFVFVLTYAIGFVINKTVGFRISADDESAGIDRIIHNEMAYEDLFGLPTEQASSDSTDSQEKVPASVGEARS